MASITERAKKIVAKQVVAENGFTGAVTGAITGNVTGNLTGNVTGNVAGNVTGNVVGGVQNPVTALSADGAITIPTVSTVFVITKGTAAALTLADPTATTHDGVILTIVATTAAAHTLDNSAGSGFNGAGAAGDVGTFGVAAGNNLQLLAYQGVWYILSNTGVVVA